MANVQNDEADQAAKEALMSSLIGALEENRDALRFLPEMLMQMIEMQKANEEKATQAHNLSGSRSFELQEASKKLTARNDDLIREVEVKDKQLKEQADKLLSLENELETLKKEKGLQDATSLERQESSKPFQARYDDLIREVDAKKELLKEQAEKFHHLQEEHKTVLSEKSLLDEEIKQMKKSLWEKEIQIKALQSSSQTIAERFEKLRETSNTALHDKDREIERMKNRVALLSEKRVKQDQSKVEDILSMNRQSTVEQDFFNFVDEAREDACEAIKSYYHSEEEIDVRIYYRRLACLIFEAAYERMKEAREGYFEFCKEVSRGLLYFAPNWINEFLTKEKQNHSQFSATFSVSLMRRELQYPTDVVDALMLTLKETARDCNLELFVQDVQSSVWNKWRIWCNEDKCCRISPNKYLLQDPRIISYITKCIQITWRMVTQVPAMKIEYRALHLEDGTHKKLGYHSSPYMQAKVPAGQVSEEEIACYLWPGLFDGGGRLIRAGEVLCKMK